MPSPSSHFSSNPGDLWINPYDHTVRYVHPPLQTSVDPDEEPRPSSAIEVVDVFSQVYGYPDSSPYYGVYGGLGKSQYADCSECYDFSMLFGGSHKGQNIETEEQFEIVKEQFVTHFNKYHKDIMEKRDKHVDKKFTKVEKPKSQSPPWEDNQFTLWATPHLACIDEPAYYNGILTSEQITAIYEGSFYNGTSHIGSTTPEYDILPVVNPANLDRNARFEAMQTRIREHVADVYDIPRDMV